MTPNRNIEQVAIIQGLNDTWIRFRDLLSVQMNLSGETYRNPTLSSWKRLLRVMSDANQVQIELIPDDTGVIILGWHLFKWQQ